MMIKRNLTADLLSRYCAFLAVLEGKSRDSQGHVNEKNKVKNYEKEMGGEQGEVRLEEVDKRKKRGARKGM